MATNARHDTGLEGVVVADTRLSDVDGERGRLVIAGHDVEALAESHRFEEVCALLWDAPVADVHVRVKSAEKRTIAETVAGLGRCEAIPDRFALLTAAAEGRVIHLLKQTGDPVEAGCAVVDLDSTIAGRNLKEKEAARDSQKASLEVLQSLPRSDRKSWRMK